MKKLLLGIAAPSIFIAFKDDNNTKAANDSEVEVIQGVQIEELSNQSEFDYKNAVTAYEEANFIAVENLIETGIKDLKEESTDFSEKEKANVGVAITLLENLLLKLKNENKKNNLANKHTETRMQNENFVSLEQLQSAFTHTELTIGHVYLVRSGKYVLKDPQKAKIVLQKSIDKMECALKDHSGGGKIAVNEMMTNLNSLLDNCNETAEEIAELLAQQVEIMASWIREHAQILGIQPAYSDSE